MRKLKAATGHVGGRQALRQQEDHVGAEAQVLGRLMGTDQRVGSLVISGVRNYLIV